MSSPVRRYLPHLILGLAISAIMVGAYAAVGFATSSSPKALWSNSPVTITFTHPGSGQFGDSFKCAPPYAKPVVLLTATNNPAVTLTVSPSTFSTCGPSFTSFTITAHSSIKTTATGTITIHETSQYGNEILPSLTVHIVAN